MRVTHVAWNVAEEASGLSQAVLGSCTALKRAGAEVELAIIEPFPQFWKADFIRAFPSDRCAGFLGASGAMKSWLHEAARAGTADVIHNHGLWRMPNVYAAQAAQRGRCKLVVSTHHSVSAWAMRYRRWRKRAFWHLAQERALRATDCFHATSESEYEDIRRLGFRQPVAVIPHGVHVPAWEAEVVPKTPTVLFLGRLHPTKGIDLLLRAWREVEPAFPQWSLDIVGPGEPAHVAALQRLAANLGVRRARFRGALYGEAKARAYRAAAVFVLPSRSESFALTVAESLASSTPVIVSRQVPWPQLRDRQAGWCVDGGVAEWVRALEAAMRTPPEALAAMGVAGARWMQRDYSWDDVAQKLLETYRWLLEPSRNERPPWVHPASPSKSHVL